MIIKYFEIKKNLKLFKKKFHIYLLYGVNIGLIEKFIQEDLKKNFSKNIFNYTENEILNNVNIFRENLLNKSFFEEDKLIIINQVTDKMFDLIKENYIFGSENLKIILKSENLEKKSKIRGFFEKNKELAIVPFYEDTDETLFTLAENFFQKNQFKISSENLNLIIEKSKKNRLNLLNELEKISVLNKKKTITFDQIIKLVNSSKKTDSSELINECLTKNKKKIINILNESLSQSDENILILKLFLKKLKNLKRLKEVINTKKNTDQVLDNFKPPIFWKDKSIIKKQLNTLSLKEINFLIKDVNRLELIIKKNPNNSYQILNNFIFETVSTNNLV